MQGNLDSGISIGNTTERAVYLSHNQLPFAWRQFLTGCAVKSFDRQLSKLSGPAWRQSEISERHHSDTPSTQRIGQGLADLMIAPREHDTTTNITC